VIHLVDSAIQLLNNWSQSNNSVDQNRNSHLSRRFAGAMLDYENSFGFAEKCLNSPLFFASI